MQVKNYASTGLPLGDLLDFLHNFPTCLLNIKTNREELSTLAT